MYIPIIMLCNIDSQVVVSVTDQVRVFENETIEFCVILWAPQPWQVDVLVSTNDNGLALGECKMKVYYVNSCITDFILYYN